MQKELEREGNRARAADATLLLLELMERLLNAYAAAVAATSPAAIGSLADEYTDVRNELLQHLLVLGQHLYEQGEFQLDHAVFESFAALDQVHAKEQAHPWLFLTVRLKGPTCLHAGNSIGEGILARVEAAAEAHAVHGVVFDLCALLGDRHRLFAHMAASLAGLDIS